MFIFIFFCTILELCIEWDWLKLKPNSLNYVSVPSCNQFNYKYYKYNVVW